MVAAGSVEAGSPAKFSRPKRRCPARSSKVGSADFQSAVSRVSNPLDVENKWGSVGASSLPTGSRRYKPTGSLRYGQKLIATGSLDL